MTTNENLPPNVIRQLAKELKNLDESPPEGIKIIVNDDDFTTADIEGPGFFLTKIFHPNIATSGEICVNTLKKDWNPTLGLRHVLLFKLKCESLSYRFTKLSHFLTMIKSVVRCLLIEPFPESALNEQSGKLLLENYDEYARHARLSTSIHALKPKNKTKTGAISESTTLLNAVSQNTPLGPAALFASTANKAFGTNLQDQNAAPSDPALGASAVPKKDGLHAVKVPAEKKKIDARKKSLKRL
uniref:UBC core domain-containing protein n=1 Tax=Leersia perrieri TaxID=77586 RepID=A0A0D9WSV5_9ORYZ